jgi:hypothetical protein
MLEDLGAPLAETLFTMPVKMGHETMVKCVEREVRMRQAAYPRWVREGRRGWTEDAARREMAAMQAVSRVVALLPLHLALVDAARAVMAKHAREDGPEFGALSDAVRQIQCAAERMA